MEQLNALLAPSWGSESWINQGWNKITESEKIAIKTRIDDLFKEGLPLQIKHDTILYIHLFALLAQLEVLGVQLSLQCEERLTLPQLKQKMRAQLLDELFHAIVFTKILFLLSAPYGAPPAYSKQIEELCTFVRSQQCVKLGLVMMNRLYKCLVEEIFAHFYKYDIAPKLFSILLKDERRHICEADLYDSIGLPEHNQLSQTLHKLEQLIISSFSQQPQYTATVSSLLGSHGSLSLISILYEKYTQQLKRLNAAPNKNLKLLIQVKKHIDHEPHIGDINKEINSELYPVEMSPMKKILMTQFNAPGDPAITIQFNMDITAFGFFQKENPDEQLTALMMQTISKVLKENDSFRNVLHYKKLYQSRSTYLSLVEKLPDCGDHLSTVSFKDCHEIDATQLLTKIKRAQQIMLYCFKKCEQIEKDHPDLKQRLDEALYSYAHELFPSPTPGSPNVFLSNLGRYGYTQAIVPLLKHSGLHIVLLAIEKKPVWNNATQAFEAKDILPISISADSRIFDGIKPIPELLNAAFQSALHAPQTTESKPSPDKNRATSYQKERIDAITDDFLNQIHYRKGARTALQLLEKNKNSVLNEVKRVFGDDLELGGEKISAKSNFKNIADQLLLEYLGFNAEEASKNANFTKNVDKILAEDLELGYRVLFGLRTTWLDYIDVEDALNTAYKKIALSRIKILSTIIPAIKPFM